MKVQVVPVLCPQCGNTIPLEAIRATFFSCPSCHTTLIIDGLAGEDIPQEINQLIAQNNLVIEQPRLRHQFLYGAAIFFITVFVLNFVEAFLITLFDINPNFNCAYTSLGLVLALILTARRKAKFNERYGL